LARSPVTAGSRAQQRAAAVNIRNRFHRIRVTTVVRAVRDWSANFGWHSHGSVRTLLKARCRELDHTRQKACNCRLDLHRCADSDDGTPFANLEDELAMAITRRRVIDKVAAITGVMVLLLALMVFDQRARYAWSGADLSTVGENVNYLAFAVTLMVAQVVRGEITEHVQLLVFMVTAVVLVVLLMRL
jgi:hypothetical protein